jgi:succinate dehydrogenase / fumarate reductase membrane anchor subunit
MSIKTPYKRVAGLGSAKEGTGHFWHQRLTAVANIPLTLFFIGLLVSLNGASYDETRAVLANPLVAIILLLFIGSGIYHMRLGLQIVIEDYVHGEGARVVALMANTFFALAMGAACVFAILKLAFAG